MSFAVGTEISAVNLNTVNNNYSYRTTMPKNADYIEDYVGNNGYFYSHRQSGQLLFHCHFGCGAFGGGHLRIGKVINGSLQTIYSKDMGWNTSVDVNFNSTGEGRYRVWSDTKFQFAQTYPTIYCADNKVASGDRIIIYDAFFISLNRLSGQELKAATLNTGRCGRY